MSDIRHVHRLTECHECDGDGCEDCSGRGYFEVCICGEPMGNARRRWKRVAKSITNEQSGSQP